MSRAATALPAINLALSMVIFGTIGLFAVEAGLPPMISVFWRCIFASLFLLPWCLLRGQLRPGSLQARSMIQAALCGLSNIASAVALFASFKTITIATATILFHVQPFLVVLIGAIVFKEAIRRHEILWLSIAFVGMALAAGLIGGPAAASPDWLTGVALALVAALLYAIATLLGKNLGRQPAEVTTLIQSLAGAIALLPLAKLGTAIPGPAWPWLICLGVIHTGLAYALMFSGYRGLSTAAIGVFAFIYPLVAVLVDWLFYHKPLTPVQIAGMALIMAGTLGVQLGWGAQRQAAAVRS